MATATVMPMKSAPIGRASPAPAAVGGVTSGAAASGSAPEAAQAGSVASGAAAAWPDVPPAKPQHAGHDRAVDPASAAAAKQGGMKVPMIADGGGAVRAGVMAALAAPHDAGAAKLQVPAVQPAAALPASGRGGTTQGLVGQKRPHQAMAGRGPAVGLPQNYGPGVRGRGMPFSGHGHQAASLTVLRSALDSPDVPLEKMLQKAVGQQHQQQQPLSGSEKKQRNKQELLHLQGAKFQEQVKLHRQRSAVQQQAELGRQQQQHHHQRQQQVLQMQRMAQQQHQMQQQQQLGQLQHPMHHQPHHHQAQPMMFVNPVRPSLQPVPYAPIAFSAPLSGLPVREPPLPPWAAGRMPQNGPGPGGPFRPLPH